MLMHVNVPLYTHVQCVGRRTSGILLCHSLPCSLEIGFSLSLKLARQPLESSYSRLPVMHVDYGYMATPAL